MAHEAHFLFTEQRQKPNETTRCGEVFVDNNFICYFAERTVADGIAPSYLQADGKVILLLSYENESWNVSLETLADSRELSLDTTPSGNGIWLSDLPDCRASEKPDELLETLATAVEASKPLLETDVMQFLTKSMPPCCLGR